MAIGVTVPTASTQTSAEKMAGLRSYIMLFFEPTEVQLEYKSNKAWNDPINGDANGSFQVYYQNVNRVPCKDVSLSQDLQALAEYNIGCFCLLETNLDWNRPYVRSKYLAQQQKTWRHSAISFSLIDMKSFSDYMTGGLPPSILDSDPSGMGRSSYQTLVGKQNSKVTIITGFQCIQNTSGDSSAWTQQSIYMKDHKSIKSPNP
jgi:hypothetical protein